MIDINRRHDVMRYQVSLGHAQVTVWSESRLDAIREARIQLSLEMPRLYDIIHSLDEGRFLVVPEPAAS